VPRDNSYEIYSSEGEATAGTKDGVRYVLRFGQLAGGSEGAGDEKPADGKEKANPALNRFLFVMAQFDESLIPKPDLQPVPGEAKPADAKPADKPADAPQEEAKPAEGEPAKPADEAKPGEEAKPAGESKPEVEENKTAAQEPAPEGPGEVNATTAKEQPAAEGGKQDVETKPEDAKPADASAEKKDEKPQAPEDVQKLAVERENKRKQDEYNDAVKKGQEKVKDLNDRFADWYFIISDDVYKKIHLSRADVVQKKDAPKPDNPAAGLEIPQTIAPPAAK
jgi:hypothetical protein